MTQIDIAVECNRRELSVRDFIEPEGNQTYTGMTNQISDSCEIEYKGTMMYKGIDTPEVLEFVLNVGGDVSKGLLGAWLFDQLKGAEDSRLYVDGELVSVQKDKIQEKLDELVEENE